MLAAEQAFDGEQLDTPGFTFAAKPRVKTAGDGVLDHPSRGIFEGDEEGVSGFLPFADAVEQACVVTLGCGKPRSEVWLCELSL